MFSRRDFLKCGVIVCSYPLFGNFVRLLPFIKDGDVSNIDAFSSLNLFMSELSRFPRGHVAHSLGKIEVLYSLDYGSYMIKGISYSADRMSAGYWAFVINEPQAHSDLDKWSESPELTRKTIKEIVFNLQRYWKNKRAMWGIAPQRLYNT